ncbi:MAG: DUF3426 domain-containing protein [Pseudomonadota bacterium]
MYTYCPNCSVVFQVSAAQLGRAGGRVRCGECRQVYSAVDYLYEDLAAVRAAVDAAGSLALTSEAARMGGIEVEPDVEERMTEPAAEMDALPPMLTGSSWEHRSLQGRDLFSLSAIAVLVVLLGMQWTFFNRVGLAADPAWRPALERFCAVLRCELPLRVDLSRLAILERDVRQHPVAAGALLINAAFENRADFTQPYPVFEVSFTDMAGNPVAMRRFRPAEYLRNGPDYNAGLPAHATVQVVLEVQDPGDKAVSYQFGFL